MRNYDGEELVREILKCNKDDYYRILGVEENCSTEEIKKAYRSMSLRVHPDKNKAGGAEEAFKRLSEAYGCLSDEELRRQYHVSRRAEELRISKQDWMRWYNLACRAHEFQNELQVFLQRLHIQQHHCVFFDELMSWCHLTYRVYEFTTRMDAPEVKKILDAVPDLPEFLATTGGILSSYISKHLERFRREPHPVIGNDFRLYPPEYSIHNNHDRGFPLSKYTYC